MKSAARCRLPASGVSGVVLTSTCSGAVIGKLWMHAGAGRDLHSGLQLAMQQQVCLPKLAPRPAGAAGRRLPAPPPFASSDSSACPASGSRSLACRAPASCSSAASCGAAAPALAGTLSSCRSARRRSEARIWAWAAPALAPPPGPLHAAAPLPPCPPLCPSWGPPAAGCHPACWPFWRPWAWWRPSCAVSGCLGALRALNLQVMVTRDGLNIATAAARHAKARKFHAAACCGFKTAVKGSPPRHHPCQCLPFRSEVPARPAAPRPPPPCTPIPQAAA